MFDPFRFRIPTEIHFGTALRHHSVSMWSNWGAVRRLW